MNNNASLIEQLRLMIHKAHRSIKATYQQNRRVILHSSVNSVKNEDLPPLSSPQEMV